MMEFSFKDSPEWFTSYLVETHMDGFHVLAKETGVMNGGDYSILPLLNLAKQYFSDHGFNVDIREKQLWFIIDETLPEVTFNALKWS